MTELGPQSGREEGIVEKRLFHVLRISALPYLTLLAVSMIGGQFLQYTFRSAPLFKAQSAGIIFVLAVAAMSLVAWLVLAPRRRMTALPLLIVIGMIILWLIATLRIASQDGAFNYTALVTPVFLMMLAFKPPSFGEAIRFGDLVSIALSVSIVTTQMLDVLGLRANRADIVSRWDLPVPGIDSAVRWEGMFTDPNYAGFIGAFLIVFGLFRWKPWLTPWLTVCGALVVYTSESRSTLVALSVGLATLVAIKGYEHAKRYVIPQWLFLLAAIALITLPLATAVAIDPSLNGRVPIWSSVIGLAGEDPILGVGSDGMLEAAQTSIIPWGNVDGHSVVFDALARNGAISAALVLTVLIGVTVLSLRAHPVDAGLSLGVFVTFLVGALTYTVTTWQYPTVQVLPLLVALLISASVSRPARTHSFSSALPAKNSLRNLLPGSSRSHR